jgi:hypothetical protein
VEAERELRVAGRRFIPDLTLRCPKSGEIRLLIEVWHTHAVSVAKRRAFATQGLPWIEVRAWHVVNRLRRQPLPVLDWGGINIDPPTQPDLFEIPPVQQGTGCSIDDFMTIGKPERVHILSYSAGRRCRIGCHTLGPYIEQNKTAAAGGRPKTAASKTPAPIA